MSETIQISVVIPTYNRAQVVGRAIDSVLKQDFAPCEILVVDDGSSDDTRRVVEAYGARVRYLHQANAGVSAARNKGVSEAKCEWIAFLDSDDNWTGQHLNRIVQAIRATDGAAALYFADTKVANEQGEERYWELCGFKINSDFALNHDAGSWGFMEIQPMVIQTSVVRRAIFIEVGGFPEQLRTREDTQFLLKLALLYPLCAVSGCGTVMNADGNVRLTRVYDTKSMVYRNATLFLYRDLLKLRGIGGKYRRELKQRLSIAYFSKARVLQSDRMALARWHPS